MAARLGQSDIKLLQLLADDFLILSRRQIQVLIPRKERRTLQRLAILIKEGYICKTEPVVDFSGRLVFYHIGERAAEVLERDRTAVLEHKRQARLLAEGQSKHTYLLNWVHIRFLKEIGAHSNVQLTKWISQDHAYWENRGVRGLQPDAYIEFAKDNVRFSYFIEVDRGTERGKSIREKIAPYEGYRRLRRPEVESSRIVFITEKAARAGALVKLFPSDAFLVATAEEVRRRPLFDSYWRNGSGTVALDVPYTDTVEKKGWVPTETCSGSRGSGDPLPPIPEPPSPPVFPATTRRNTEDSRNPGRPTKQIPVVGYLFVSITLFVLGIVLGLAYRISGF